MQRVLRAFPNISTYTNNFASKPIYTRFHRKPQVFSSKTQANKTYKIQTNLEDESMNNYISDMYKEKKYRGVLDPAAPNNKNIFIDTDSEHQKSGRNHNNLPNEKKSEKLLIAKTESQYPYTYNSRNVFSRDGVIKGYFIKSDENDDNNNIINNINNINKSNVYIPYNTLTKNTRKRININTPSPDQEAKFLYNYNNGAKTQVRDNRVNQNFLDQTCNKSNITNRQFKKEIDLDEWPSIERTHDAKLYFRNKDIQVEDKEKTDYSNYVDNDNINQYQSYYKNQGKRYPAGMVYQKGNIGEIKGSYSKSNMSDISEDFLSQNLKKPETNYIVAGNTSGFGSPYEYRNNYIMGTSEEESERQPEFLYNNEDPQIYMNKRIIRGDMNIINEAEHGGIVDLNYGINKGKNRIINNNNIIMRKKRDMNNILNEIQNDINKYNLLIKLQRFIKSYLYLREECAMKIQAVWRGGNTRRIMDLYNDLDEFIYHLSKVQFNHFNNDFCFFVKQLFNIYKANVSTGNFIENDDNENNNEDEENNENEKCINQLTLEEIEKKENPGEYLYKYPEGSCFGPEKLELENEIALFVEASNPYERKNEKKSREYERLLRDYEELNQQLIELKMNNTASNRFVPKKEKNESESAFGSIKNEFKFQKNEKYGSHSRDKVNSKKNTEKRQKKGDIAKNLTISKDYDGDLEDINKEDDFFNPEISYDGKDNSGSLAKDKRYSYFSLHSDENSKFFDNENLKEKEIKEGDNYKINTSKNSGGSKYNNNSTKNTGYTGYYSLNDKSKLIGLQKTDKRNKELTNSPSEKSNNYIGHHSKTLPRKFKNYIDSNNSTLIIPKHEEDFNIINNKLYLSPNENKGKTHMKNIASDNAITSGNRLEDKNWNEIIEYIKNEEIEIPTQKRMKKIKLQKEPKKFDILEKDKSQELNIDNKDYRNKKLNKILVEHENEINIIRRKSKQEIEKEKALIKSIEEKDKQITLIKQKLEEITNKLNEAKVFNSKLEINKNLNNLYINGIKKQKMILDKMNIDKINISRKPKEFITKIHKNNEFCINEFKAIPETMEETTDTRDLIPKQIKITTKKVVKKTDTLQHRFKNNSIISENALNINGIEKMKPVFEEESQENNRFSVENMVKEESKDNAKENINKEEEEKKNLRLRVINPEELEVNKPIEYIINPDEEKLKEKEKLEKKEIFEKVKNNVISLNPTIKKQIKIVTKKITKKTNLLYSKFNENKTIISTGNQLDIKGIEKPKEPEPVQKEIHDWKNNEIAQEKIFNINGIGKKFENIQLPKEEDKNNNRFCIENDLEIPVIYKIDNTFRENKNIINKKSQFSINGIVKKPEENIIDNKSKFTINGIQKEPVLVNEQGIQYERNVDDLREKMTDTNDLIRKQIKITTKKTVKKTNIIKKPYNNIVTLEFRLKIEGNEMPEEKIEKEEEIKPKEEPIEIKDWNKILQKDCQTNDFVINSISKNIYEKYDELKLNQEKEKEKEKEKLKEKEEEKMKEKEIIKVEEQKEEKELIKEKEPIKEEEKKEEKEITKEQEKKEEKEEEKPKEDKKEVLKIDNIEIKISGEKPKEEKVQELQKEKIIYIEKEKDWNKQLIEETQPNISIERILQSIPKPQENIIEKKINFNIFGTEEAQKEKIIPEPKEEPVQTEPIKSQSDWKDLLKEDIQEKEFIIKGKEIEIKKPNQIQKDIVINIEATNSLPLAKNKILEDWKYSNLQEQSETLKIENKKKREIKITTKKIIKKTNNLYKTFGNNLEITKNDLGITGKGKVKSNDFKTENIQINIDKSYQPKIMKELEIEKNKEILINANDYKKKQIQIRTKKTVAKTNYVYKRFNNIKITNVTKISIESTTPQSTIISSFGNEKLEKVELNENKFTIEKTEDPKKEQELKEKIQKETVAQLEIKFQKEKEEMQKDFEKQNNELKNELRKENEEMKNILEKENKDIKSKLEKENEDLKNKYEKENEELKIKLEKENEEIKSKLEKENEDLKIRFEKGNEELKTKLEKEKEELKIKLEIEKENEIKELKEKQKNFENVLPIATDEFSVDNDYDEEEENKRKLEEIIEEYNIGHIELCFGKEPTSVSEQGIQKDEEKPEMGEKTTDTFDLEKREIRITRKTILKKTNVLYHQFKNNSVCSDTKININKPSNMLKERKKVINKVESFTINKTEAEKEKENEISLPKTNNFNLLEIKKNEDINIPKNKNLGQNNNVIDKVNNIQLFNDKLPKPEETITEKSYEDNNQLTNAECDKSNKKLTDKKDNTLQEKSPSYNNIISVNITPNESEIGEEGEKKLYKKRNAPNSTVVKAPCNKKKKIATLVIKLDNKFDLKNSFNKWNTLTPNLLIIKEKKEESANIKQIIKEKEKDKDKNKNSLNTLDNNNERITDNTTNIEKSLEDSNINPQKTVDNNNNTNTNTITITNNFDTINLDDKNTNTIEQPISIGEETRNLNIANKKKKLKLKNILLNKENKQNNDNNGNEEKEIIINKINNMNLNSINSNNDEIIYKDKNDMNENKRESVNSNNFNFNSLSNETSSSIEIIDKSSSSKNEQEKLENQDKEEEPKKKEIVINKKVCIVSKNVKKGKIMYAEAKKKFFHKRFMMKFWKIWKNNTFKMFKSLDPKSTQKPFTFKPKKIHKRILGSQETFKSIKNKLMSQNQKLIIRHFFLKWNKDLVHETNEFKGIRIIENILRRHIITYLLMHGKMMKLKKLLIKCAFDRKK